MLRESVSGTFDKCSRSTGRHVGCSAGSLVACEKQVAPINDERQRARSYVITVYCTKSCMPRRLLWVDGLFRTSDQQVAAKTVSERLINAPHVSTQYYVHENSDTGLI